MLTNKSTMYCCMHVIVHFDTWVSDMSPNWKVEPEPRSEMSGDQNATFQTDDGKYCIVTQKSTLIGTIK